MKCDTQVHIRFSCDKEADMAVYCDVGKKKDIICFTEHVGFNKIDDGYGYYQPDLYFERK